MSQGNGFEDGASSTFGAIFGNTTQPTTGGPFGSAGHPTTGGLLGSTTQLTTGGPLGSAGYPTTGELFGSRTPTPAFGQPQTTSPSYGGFSRNYQNLFWPELFRNIQNASTGTGLFGSTTTSAFGLAKPAFGSGMTQTTSPFGHQSTAQTQQQSTNIFGQTRSPSTGLFTTSGGFGNAIGAPTNAGTGSVKYVAVTSTDKTVKNGVLQIIRTNRHHCITCMKEYESKSLEELRMEDYAASRKGPRQDVQPSGIFRPTTQPYLFGFEASAFGASTPQFNLGQPSTNSAGTSLFGANPMNTP